MWVISKTRLRAFWETPGRADAEGPLRAWHKYVSNRTVAWEAWTDVRTAFATASKVGGCVVFNIAGNKYRLIARIRYASHKVFVLKVLTHREYDEQKWKQDCGCFQSPPTKAARGIRRTPR
jgi:mRNA interferase HigB